MSNGVLMSFLKTKFCRPNYKYALIILKEAPNRTIYNRQTCQNIYYRLYAFV